jgi:enoyl-[acyl-carrier-protein] reductase (NADH)
VRVNCIAPGLVRTHFARALWENAEISRAAEEQAPLRRLGEPDDVAGAAVFLSAPATRFVTGQIIVVDGGDTIAGSSLGGWSGFTRHAASPYALRERSRQGWRAQRPGTT